MNFPNLKCLCVATAIGVMGSTASIAGEKQASAAGYGERPVKEWTVKIGALGMLKPEYEGSDDYEVTGFPNVDIRWRDRAFLNARDGLGVNIWNDRMFTLSTSVGYTFGRDHDKSSDLNGLGDIEGGALAVVKGSIRHRGFSLSGRLSHQLTGDDTGFLANFGLGYMWRSQQGWFLRPGLQTSLASGEYMERYFGVTTGQSFSSGLRAFDADGGFKSFGAGILAGYALDEHWSIGSRASYDRLVGDAADSPITKAKDQFKLSLGLTYSF